MLSRFSKLLPSKSRGPSPARGSSNKQPVPSPPVDSDTTYQAENQEEYHDPVLSDSGKVSVVDIVFVHGLRGGPIKTWRNATTGFLWPAEVYRHLGPLRAITYGYDAEVTSFYGHASRNRLGDHARNLIGDLSNLREDPLRIGQSSSLCTVLEVLLFKKPLLCHVKHPKLIYEGLNSPR